MFSHEVAVKLPVAAGGGRRVLRPTADIRLRSGANNPNGSGKVEEE
jgi:hypothetical protein